jgi:hypothetical protein
MLLPRKDSLDGGATAHLHRKCRGWHTVPVKDFDATGRLYRMAGAGSIHEAEGLAQPSTLSLLSEPERRRG